MSKLESFISSVGEVDAIIALPKKTQPIPLDYDYDERYAHFNNGLVATS